MTRIGLYFGTFNPIHIGHCVIAQHMREYTDLDEVWFVVTPHNPHKKKNNLLQDHERLHMVRLALGAHYQLRVSDVEFGLPQPSYTSYTLAHLAEKFPQKEFHLIMGADNLASFPRWKNYETILQHHHLYVYPRIESDGGELRDHPHVHLTEAPIMQIASTHIRQSIREGKDVSFMLPPEVAQHIHRELHYR